MSVGRRFKEGTKVEERSKGRKMGRIKILKDENQVVFR